jgi:Arylsulfotransferase (ASST)
VTGGAELAAQGLTRRQLLGRGGVAVAGVGGLAAAGAAGYAWPRGGTASPTAAPAPAAPAAPAGSATPDDTRGVLHFVSRADLTPPAVTIAHRRNQSVPRAQDPPYLLVAAAGYPLTGPGTPGLMILNRDGHIVWYSPNTDFPASTGSARVDFQVQSYRGQPVLTWWEGKVVTGHGYGQAVIADSSYNNIATVKGGNGLQPDLHEFVITPQDTALVTAYRTVSADLSKLGGPANGAALSGTVLEIDIASGRVLFEWSSLDHVPVTDTFVPFAGGTKAAPFDYLHINSIAIAPDGNLLVSARNTSTVYKVARPSGEVIWRLGGKQSSFQMGEGATFWWQHHVRPQGSDVLSIFDDGASPAREPQSRAILLDLDTTAMRATLKASFTHPAGLLAANQGSMQVLPDGRVLVGWGNLPYLSEYAADGTLLLDGQFPIGDQTYRAFAGNWTGHPTDPPALAARANPAGGSTVYASWNGATELASWTVLAGSTATGLKQVGSQEHSGFETAITVNTAGPYFAVTANDSGGHVLSRSATVRLASS